MATEAYVDARDFRCARTARGQRAGKYLRVTCDEVLAAGGVVQGDGLRLYGQYFDEVRRRAGAGPQDAALARKASGLTIAGRDDAKRCRTHKR